MDVALVAAEVPAEYGRRGGGCEVGGFGTLMLLGAALAMRLRRR